NNNRIVSPMEMLAAAPEDGALVLPILAAGQAFAFVVANGTVGGVEFRDQNGTYLIDQRVLEQRVVNDDDSWLRTYYATLHDPSFHRGTPLYQEWTAYLHKTLTWLWTTLLGPLDAYL